MAINSIFLRNVGVLVSGTAIGRLITLVALPVLTRIYSPHDFEILAVYVAVLTMLTMVANLRFNIAISLPEDDKYAVNLLVLSLLSAALIFTILLLVVTICPAWLSSLFGQAGFTPYEWMIPLGFIMAACYQGLQYWQSRVGRFGVIARTRITRAVGGSIAQIGLGMTVAGPFGLVFGQMLMLSLGAFALAFDVRNRDKLLLTTVTRSSIVKATTEYKRFPLYSTPEALATSAALQVPILLIASQAGSQAGYLTLALQVLMIPFLLIGQSTAQVFLAEAPSKYRAGELKAFTIQLSTRLLVLGICLLVPLGVLAPYVFPLVFGAEWYFSGELVAWLVPWHIMQLTVSPITAVLHVLGYLRQVFIAQLVGATLRIGAVLWAVSFYPSMLVEALAIASFIFYFLFYLYILSCLSKLQRDE